jgi:hypothetical protein
LVERGEINVNRRLAERLLPRNESAARRQRIDGVSCAAAGVFDRRRAGVLTAQIKLPPRLIRFARIFRRPAADCG